MTLESKEYVDHDDGVAPDEANAMLKNCDPGIRGEIWLGRKGGRRELPAKPDGPYTLVAAPLPQK